MLTANVLWRGKVADDNDEDTAALKALNRKIYDDRLVDRVLLPVSDGLTVAIKR